MKELNVIRPLYIAHRGHGTYANTEKNFRNSKNYYGVECDIRISKDGKFVISHDEYIKYDNGQVLYISECEFSILQSRRFKGNKICALSSFLNICKQLGKFAIIELKVDLNDDKIVELLDEIDKYYCKERCIIISFYKHVLEKVKRYSNILLMLLFDVCKEKNMRYCIDNKIIPSIYFRMIKKEDVDIAHEHGLKIGAWTVNSIFANAKMKKLKVDYITSDKFWL